MRWSSSLCGGATLALIALIGCSRQPTPVPPTQPTAPLNPPVVTKNAPPQVDADWVRSADPYTLEYKPGAEVTLRGDILGIRRIPLSDDREGLLIRVHAGGSLPWVYLGPDAWVTERSGTLAMSQPVSVTGAWIEENGQPLLIARRIHTADARVDLRDELGTPRWPLPAIVASSTKQSLEERRQEYLKQMLAYHQREAEAIRAKLSVKPVK